MTSEIESLERIRNEDLTAVGLERQLHWVRGPHRAAIQRGPAEPDARCGMRERDGHDLVAAGAGRKALVESGRITTSLAPGQPSKTARTCRVAGSMRLTELPTRLATTSVLPSGETRSSDRLFAGTDDGDFAARFHVENGDAV